MVSLIRYDAPEADHQHAHGGSTSSWTCTAGSFTARIMNEISATPVTP